RATLRLAPPETMVEAQPNDSVPSAEDMFLSPRVLDAGAFARYADTLKSLITDARKGARDLQDSAADADEMAIKCEQTGEMIKSRVEAGARVIKLIDERADRAEQLMQTARERLPDAETLERDARAAAEAALSDVVSRADAIARGVETKSDLAASDATRRLEQSAEKIEARLTSAAAAASEQADRLEHAVAAIDARLAAIDERVALLTGRTERAADRAETELGPTIARAEQCVGSIEQAMTAARQSAETEGELLAERIREQVRPAQEVCDAVMRRLSIESDSGDPGGSLLAQLEGLVERSERAGAACDRSAADTREIIGQAERVRNDFGTWLLEAAANLDILEARRERLVGPLGEAADRIAQISPSLKEELDAAALQLDQLQTEQAILREAVGTSVGLARQSGETLNNQAAQMRALVDGSMQTLTARVEEAGLWLGELIQRAEQLGNGNAEGTRLTAGMPELREPDRSLVATDIAPNEQLQPEDAIMSEHPHPMDTQTMPSGETHQTAEPKMQDYGLPAPPALPIDAVSFDGADIVFGSEDDNGAQAAD
ncbi:MAG: hypothetical protein AAGA55_04980, partial [Planctomycetota bacterium]